MLSVPSTLPVSPRSWPRSSRIWSTSSFSAFHRSSNFSRRDRSASSFSVAAASRAAVSIPTTFSRSMIFSCRCRGTLLHSSRCLGDQSSGALTESLSLPALAPLAGAAASGSSAAGSASGSAAASASGSVSGSGVSDATCYSPPSDWGVSSSTSSVSPKVSIAALISSRVPMMFIHLTNCFLYRFNAIPFRLPCVAESIVRQLFLTALEVLIPVITDIRHPVTLVML